MIARTVELIGVDHVAIGSDISRNVTSADLVWMRRGRWTRRNHRGADVTGRHGQDLVAWPDFADSTAKYTEFPAALARAGFSDTEAAAILGGNWLRLFRQVFVSPARWLDALPTSAPETK
jgi:microsomal dipeptidase-like Zn-dependent dipeptidase